MDLLQLTQTTREIISKTILAADESTGTIEKRFATIGVPSTPETNRQYRQLLCTTPDIEKYVSGVILFDETIRQKTDDGMSFPKYLAKRGIVPGIKVDAGTLPLAGHEPDTYTQGLDYLGNRLDEYATLGARFAKWRAVITIEHDHPSNIVIDRNAHDLALYARICQEHTIVPIVEPEVLIDGNHTIDHCYDVTLRTLTAVFSRLQAYGVYLEGMILKPNMVTQGSDHDKKATTGEVAPQTLKVLAETVPITTGGIAFLSGGQSPDIATEHLQAINATAHSNKQTYPWRITASYGRALQGETIEAWAGKKENIQKAQAVFLSRAKKVYSASLRT